MRIPRIYQDIALNVGDSVTLDSRSSHYVGNVLRLEPGRPLRLFNGDGNDYPAVVETQSKKQLQVRIENCEPCPPASPLHIHLGIAISRGERMDWVLQKATELGAAAITPLFSERVEVRLKGERLEKKQQHWQQIIISACEQSGRGELPQLHPTMELTQWQQQNDCTHKLLLAPSASSGLPDNATATDTALLIGPEGGLSDAEISTASEHGFKALQLGPRVLRTETAPLAAISILQHRWGDMG